MEAVTETRIKDDAKELAEKPSGGDSGDNLGGAPGQESGTATTGTAAAATETTKTDKEGMPGTNSGQDQDGGLGGSGGGQSTTYVEFPRGNNYVPVYYMSEGTAAIKYSTNDIVLKNIYWQTTGSGGNKIANAAYKSGDDNPELTKGFQKVTDDQLTLLLDEAILKGYFDKTMEILVDWESEDKKFTGNTRSLYFSVSNKSQTDTTLQEKIVASASSEVSLETTTAATATSSASATDSASSSGGGGGGLSTGAKAGIAVGAVIGGLLIIGALAFFLLRRRRRSKQLGEDYTSQQAYTVDKETHGRATDSPNSPYSDENQVQPVALQNISHDHEEQTARGTPTPNNLPRTSTGSRNAPTPQGMSSNVAHLVEDGMTAEEIRRLEEEERELDDEIERAARR
ncbi:hypothetical protein FSOLCH5_001098 [Fusarium solani]|uniref:Mid2 domain-containing protein n=1 Tax=Fusarium solani TaxID=169388 RepID=A0A9P9L4X9_FUSSL|nr:uncharacterized protein B0J15DRAFT_117088 [Fusarium solani]KAH7274023.1 hypothetical protein B0J15DRAFT_117088 [Fusarium solani]